MAVPDLKVVRAAFGSNFVMWSLNSWDYSQLAAWEATYTPTWPDLVDDASKNTAYGVTAAPTFFIIDTAGVIRFTHVGNPGSATLISEINTLLPIANQPPVANFVWTPASPNVNQAVAFDASSSNDPDGTIVSYAWDFGDGGTGTGVGPTHTYTTTGTKSVTLTVTDNGSPGLTGSTTKTVTVNPPPEVQVCVDIKPGSCPNPINVKSKGVFAVAIKGAKDFNVRTIDPATVKIYIGGVAQGVSPIRWSYEDVVMADGYLDIVFHFDTQTVVTKLGLAGHLGETLPLIIKGNLYPAAGGLPIQGQDNVWILPKS